MEDTELGESILCLYGNIFHTISRILNRFVHLLQFAITILLILIAFIAVCVHIIIP